MLRVIVFAACLLAAPAHAEVIRYGSLGVGTADLALDTDIGVHKLAIRIRDRMWSLCGDPHRALQTYVSTGGGKKERAACKANLRVDPKAPAAVQKAFAIALEKFD